tara:strand:- start:1413 stop:3083 length:1671 start_codon:yes stop_codon:yes gene_type:complete
VINSRRRQTDPSKAKADGSETHQDPTTTKSSRLKTIYVTIRSVIIYLEKDPIVRFFVALLFLATLLQISIDLMDRRDERSFRAEEREFRKKEQLARSWSDLINPSVSANGKISALEYLYSNGVSFRGIDLSCETLGRGWNEETLTCARPLDLSGLDLSTKHALNVTYKNPDEDPSTKRPSYPWLEGCLAVDVEMTEAEFTRRLSSSYQGKTARERFSKNDARRDKVREGGADFREALLSGIYFGRARVSGADFSKADLRGATFSQGVAEAADFSGSKIEGLTVSNSFLMGATFSEESVSPRMNGAAQRRNRKEISNRARFNNVWLDGAVLDFSMFDMNILEIRDTSLTNAEIDILTTLSKNSFGECLRLSESKIMERIECLDRYSVRDDIYQSDLSCSMVFNDVGLGLRMSNISQTRFPSRHRANPENVGWDIGIDERPAPALVSLKNKYTEATWSPPEVDQFQGAYFHPWSWADRPPIGNLTGEVIVVCDEQERPDDLGRAPRAEFPKECTKVNSETGATDTNVWSFPEPEMVETLQLPDWADLGFDNATEIGLK